ncbi:MULTISPECIES: hypothetical protein [Marinobacter]|uniref:hypothetical protein n=1 Tax=Marinobacter TaxID=2742 RepID=UPI001107D94E|nr:MULTISPECIES: hypothetical protein [Marinobacter]
MTDETFRLIAAYTGVGAIGGALLSLLVILTVAFSRVAQIEELISAAGTSAQRHQKVWGNAPFGRLMRSSSVFTFLVFRAAPFDHLKRSAAQIGDVSANLPLRLWLWGLVPPLSLFGCCSIFVLIGLFFS